MTDNLPLDFSKSRPFFVIEAEYAGQGLSVAYWHVHKLLGVWPSPEELARYIDGRDLPFGGALTVGLNDHGNLFVYTD